MLQCAVTHARRTSPHLNTKYKKLNRNQKKFKKINPQAKEVRRMLQQNLNQNKIKINHFFFQKNLFLVVISTPVGNFDPGGDGAHPPTQPKTKIKI